MSFSDNVVKCEALEEKCMKNRENREKVQFQQKTGSRCFVAHCHAVKQDKYKDVEPTSIDLFKECHCSSKNGFSEPIQKAIDDMEAILAEPAEEGKEQKSPTDVFSQVLPRSKFLQTFCIVTAAPKRSGKAAVATRMQELESELDAEKLESAALKGKLEAQEVDLLNLKENAKSSETRIEKLQKAQEEQAMLLHSLINLGKG